MKAQIAGQLFWRDHSYLLSDPHPVLEKKHWMTDDMREFRVISEGGTVYSLIVTPPFAVSYRLMGDKMDVQEQEVEIQNTHSINSYLFDKIT